MADAVDTSLVWDIEQDQTKLNLRLLGALVFVVVGIWAITGDISHTRRGAMIPYFGWACVVLSGALGLFYIWQMVRPVTPIISPATDT